MVRVGAGTHVYEQLESWEKLPEGWVLGQTAIVTDSQDRVYLAQELRFRSDFRGPAGGVRPLDESSSQMKSARRLPSEIFAVPSIG